MDTAPEIDFDDFLEELFKNPPKNKNEIVLTLDCDNLRVLFERLLSIFHHGTLVFFGDENNKVDLSSLTVSDFNMLNQYFISFGISINYKIIKDIDMECYIDYVRGKSNYIVYGDMLNPMYSRDISMHDIVTFKKCNSGNLDDYRFKITVKDNIYVIWFNYL